MREGTTSRVPAADRPYGEFYDFYSVSPEHFGSTLVLCNCIVLHLEDNTVLNVRSDFNIAKQVDEAFTKKYCGPVPHISLQRTSYKQFLRTKTILIY
jgi:hypothetical protein